MLRLRNLLPTAHQLPSLTTKLGSYIHLKNHFPTLTRALQQRRFASSAAAKSKKKSHARAQSKAAPKEAFKAKPTAETASKASAASSSTPAVSSSSSSSSSFFSGPALGLAIGTFVMTFGVTYKLAYLDPIRAHPAVIQTVRSLEHVPAVYDLLQSEPGKGLPVHWRVSGNVSDSQGKCNVLLKLHGDLGMANVRIRAAIPDTLLKKRKKQGKGNEHGGAEEEGEAADSAVSAGKIWSLQTVAVQCVDAGEIFYLDKSSGKPRLVRYKDAAKRLDAEAREAVATDLSEAFSVSLDEIDPLVSARKLQRLKSGEEAPAVTEESAVTAEPAVAAATTTATTTAATPETLLDTEITATAAPSPAPTREEPEWLAERKRIVMYGMMLAIPLIGIGAYLWTRSKNVFPEMLSSLLPTNPQLTRQLGAPVRIEGKHRGRVSGKTAAVEFDLIGSRGKGIVRVDGVKQGDWKVTRAVLQQRSRDGRQTMHHQVFIDAPSK